MPCLNYRILYKTKKNCTKQLLSNSTNQPKMKLRSAKSFFDLSPVWEDDFEYEKQYDEDDGDIVTYVDKPNTFL